MRKNLGQKDLFKDSKLLTNNNSLLEDLDLSSKQIINWQNRIINYQSKILKTRHNINQQSSLFPSLESSITNNFDPLKLTPLPINFWRFKHQTQEGPAIYIVMDKPKLLKNYIVLYIGETKAADLRWKGEHDCKDYLNAYSEALSKVGIRPQLSIRFWHDVPEQFRQRRRLEQELIQLWLPPFNKETRKRWSTPFTAELS